VLAEGFSGGEFGDSDGCFVDEQENLFECVSGADSSPGAGLQHPHAGVCLPLQPLDFGMV
jgi:hypothetical protein